MREIRYKVYIKELNNIFDVNAMIFLDEWIRVFVKWDDTRNYLVDWENVVLLEWFIYNWLEFFEWDIVEFLDYWTFEIRFDWVAFSIYSDELHISNPNKNNLIINYLHNIDKFKNIWNKYLQNDKN